MYEALIRYKWTCDGIKTIDEGIERLEGRIKELRRIKELGGQVDSENNSNDYIRFYGVNPLLKEELSFENEGALWDEDEKCICGDEECISEAP